MLNALYLAMSAATALLGGALLIVWVVIEASGFGGALICLALRRGWLVLPAGPRRVRKARDTRWGVAVRAAGLRSKTPVMANG
jgi:hypothetical protein